MRLTLPHPARSFRQSVLILALLCLGIRLAAQTPTYRHSAGTTANSFPLNSAASNMCQWLLTPADLSPTVPTSGIMITTVYFQAGNTRSASTTWTNLVIKLSTNSALTALASGPWHTGLTTVYSPATTTINGWTSGDWIPFTLATPIFYNGTGNLLIEMSQTGYTSGGGMSVRQSTGTGNRRMYGSTTSTSSTSAGTNRINFGFDAAPAACSGQPSTPTITSAAMNPASPICSGSTRTISGSNANLGSGVTFQWQQATAAGGPWTNATGGSGATTINYTTPQLTANRFYRLRVTCTNSNLSANSSAYQVLVGAPQPATISGSTNFCPGDSLTFSTTNVTGSTYSWTLPTGWTGTSTSSSIRVRPGTAAGSVSVTASSSCGSSIARLLAIVRGSAPTAPASVSGSSLICPNTAQQYSVAPVAGATSYAWTLPTGWTGSATTPSIGATASATSGAVTVRAVNGCGQSGAANLSVAIISALANPGPISGKDTVCSGALQTYAIQPVNGATSYTWVFPSGWSGTTTGTLVQTFAGTASDSIRVTAHVSCASSPVSAKRVNVIPAVTPTISLTAPTGTLCSGLPLTFTANVTGAGNAPQYTWRVNGTAVSATGATYITNTIRNGDLVTVRLRSSAACATDTSVSSAAYTATVINAVTPGVSINTTPPTSICKGTEVAFSAVSTAAGPAPVYQWAVNGTAVPGANGTTFSSKALQDQDTISISMTSNAVCATLPTVQSNRIGVHVVDSLLPSVNISVSPSEVIEAGMELRFEATETGGGATPDFQWIRNGVNIPFATGPVFTTNTLLPGDHISVRMFSYLSCATRPVVFSNIIDLTDGRLSVGGAARESLTLYPNPNTGSFAVRGPVLADGGVVRIEVVNAIGQTVSRKELHGNGAAWEARMILPASAAAGVYQLRASVEPVRFGEPSVITRSFVIQR